MSLFQNSVLSKYLKGLDSEKVNEAYAIFTSHFHNLTIQENIRNSKEEQYQGEFLIDLFVNVLGYVKNPTPDFNLTTELKNIKDSKKTDGAIVSRGLNPLELNALAVIELKGTNTTDLSKVETQAFGYKNNQPGCNYVITSNFEKLRFYIDNAVDFEEFNLFQLTKERFDILWLCLSSGYLLKDIPKKIKDESLTQEENITKKLYKDYASFRNEIFDSIQKENPEYDKLTLFKKTQKLLDRFLFIFFAEDRLLLPPNSIRSIVNQWTDLRDKYDAYFPLYDRFKKYFGYMNTGHKGQQHDIFAYNGGLFAPDDVLDNIKINDDLLFKHTVNLSNYDFESEISVNILGHIFEHSLTEIESIQNQIESNKEKNKGLNKGLKPLAEMENKQKQLVGKRKKDGVFYTPKYITKYIVDNTIGKLCDEKKTELDIQESEYEKERKGRQKATLKKLTQKLNVYRKWLLQVTICDPACGSGAFLNQSLEFLIKEHRYIDELQAKLFGDAIILSEVENTILENNLFGVDINQESVEIAKLSLWLRTAQKGRKLTSLNNNIKCGNSLIDDPNIAGDKAFNWHIEFPTVFKEKDKKTYHITTAIHDSRTSARMVKYKVRERRDLGTNPYPNIIYFTPEDNLIITQSISDIVKEDNLNLLAYNICADHILLLLVCDIDEIPAIMQKIKGRTSHELNVHKGFNKGFKPLAEGKKKSTKPLWQQKYSAPKEVTSQEQLYNTVKYIQTNRNKHELPAHSKKLQKIIDTMTCTLDKAFKSEYTGGFDVVIGNPPYVRQELFKDIKPYLEKNYKCYNSVADLYTYFIEKGINLIKKEGVFSFILPNKFLKATYGKNIRKVMKEDANLELLLDFDDYPVFADATTYPIIYVLNKIKNYKNDFFIYSEINKRVDTTDPIHTLELKKHKVSYEALTDEIWNFIDLESYKILEKLNKNSISLKKYVDNKIFRGVSTGCNEVFILNQEIKNRLGESKNIKKILMGKEVKRNTVEFQNTYLLFIPWDYDLNCNEKIKGYLIENKAKLEVRPEVKEGRFNWWCLSRYGSKNAHLLSEPKIIYPRINNQTNFFIDSSGEFSLSDNNFFISTNQKELLSILNSKLIFFFLKSISSTLQGGYFDFRRPYIEKIPIKVPSKTNERLFVEKANQMLSLNRELQEVSASFLRMLQRKFQTTKGLIPLQISKKMELWYTLTFTDFIKELKKKKIKLSLPEEAEWEIYFLAEQQKAQTIKAEIDKTDHAIDQMVYKLYGLTDAEIKIVEKATA